MTGQYYFKVNGMTSPGCEQVIERAVKSVRGVEFVEADMESGMVIIKGGATTDELIRAIDAGGYNAILIAD